MGIMMTVPSHNCIEELGGERLNKITSRLGNDDVFSRQHFATCCTNIVCLAGSSRIHKLEAPTSSRVCFAKWHHSRSLGSLRWSHLPDGWWRLWNFFLGNFFIPDLVRTKETHMTKHQRFSSCLTCFQDLTWLKHAEGPRNDLGHTCHCKITVK